MRKFLSSFLAALAVLMRARPATAAFLFVALVLMQPSQGEAQSVSNTCTAQGGTVGANLFASNGSFGTGSGTAGTTGSPLPAGTTDYTFATYSGGSPNDGQYSIVNRLNTNTFNYWFSNVSDHTTGTVSGQMMVVNAAFAPGVFYRQTLTVTPNTNYDFSGWMLNLANPTSTGWTSYPSPPGVFGDPTQPGGNQAPNVSFMVNRVGLDAAPIDIFNTGNIPFTSAPTWVQYGGIFNSGSATSIQFAFRNNAPGGVGNDFALDDLRVAPCNGLPVGSISGVLYEDSAGNNIYNAGIDPLLPAGTVVNLFNSSGALVSSQKINASGAYSFTNILAGSGYQLRVESATVPAGYSFSANASGANTTGIQTGVTVSSGTTLANQNFGFRRPTDLAITKTNAVTAVNAGGTTTYTVRVTNNGPGTITSATLSDPVAAGLSKTAVACSATPGQCVTAPTVSQIQAGFSLPTLASGQFYEVRVTATVTATSGSVSNVATATVPSGTTDPTPGNNSATDTDTVTPVADLSVTKTNAVTAVDAGGLATYVVRVTNNGPSSVTGATLSDPVATGLSKIAIACSLTPGQCTVAPTVSQIQAGFSLPTLASGQFYEVIVTATVTATYGSVSNVATATVPSGTTDPSAGNNSATDTDTVTPVFVPPPFSPGPGLSTSLCGVTPATDAWDGYAISWTNNSPLTTNSRTDIFASMGAETASGLNSTVFNTILEIDRTSVPAAYDSGRYLGYSFTTTNFTGIAEIWGIGVGALGEMLPTYAENSGAFSFSVLIDDDPAFASPDVLLTQGNIDQINFPDAQATYTQDTGWNMYGFGHWDVDGKVVQVQPNTTYYVRAYIYDDIASGYHWSQQFADIVMWDDFTLKASSCVPTPIDAIDDDYSATPVDGIVGGTAGNALANDTFNSVAADPALVSLSVLTPATPIGGAPVPYLVTADGAGEGDVIVPAGTPLATYTIVYDLCEIASPLNCDTATITVPVIEATEADLSLTKQAISVLSGLPVAQAAPGDLIEFVLTVTNDGPAHAGGVQVKDLLPSGFTYVLDDALLQGDTYDPATGIWTLGNVASGSSATLTIRTVLLETGDHTNTAEIVASDIADIDSDVATGPLVDDLADGIADDDEASVTVAIAQTAITLSGRVFLDAGTGGGIAFDGLLNGAEAGTDRATLVIRDGAGIVIATPALAGDGGWTAALPDGFTGLVTIELTPDAGTRTVSETGQVLPGLINADIRDGSFSFIPASGTAYTGLDIGLIESAHLNQSQKSAIRAGQAVSLRHEYVAQSDATVVFSIASESASVVDGFSSALFLDVDCDGAGDSVVSGPVAATAGVPLCLVARISASSGLAPGASYSFDLVADTTYGGSGLTDTARNTDRVLVDEGAIVLRKTVRNVTQGTAEGITNAAAPGDVLEYRITLEHIGTLPAADIQIHDRTPPYTRLDAPLASPVTLSAGLTCIVAEPISNLAGYMGDLRWDCTGLYYPGMAGSVTFHVRIAN
ncbi:SdrD B-like domain-containing protein [Thioclava sp. FR2]|uniref:SdrD B-like domain-containing protein n=1 Tax=Thioclava sp. FR2 TaxID=3445780 RepID=UPI003EBAEA66